MALVRYIHEYHYDGDFSELMTAAKVRCNQHKLHHQRTYAPPLQDRASALLHYRQRTGKSAIFLLMGTGVGQQTDFGSSANLHRHRCLLVTQRQSP